MEGRVKELRSHVGFNIAHRLGEAGVLACADYTRSFVVAGRLGASSRGGIGVALHLSVAIHRREQRGNCWLLQIGSDHSDRFNKPQ